MLNIIFPPNQGYLPLIYSQKRILAIPIFQGQLCVVLTFQVPTSEALIFQALICVMLSFYKQICVILSLSGFPYVTPTFLRQSCGMLIFQKPS